jgi:nitrite reductase (NADH) large subunit
MRLVVVGNGMVGQRLLEELGSAIGEFSVTVLCEEPRPAYDRVQLSAYFAGKSAADLSLADPAFFHRAGIDLKLCEKAASIDRERRCVISSAGHRYPYDRLVLATGSYPFVPPIPGSAGPGRHVYRTLEDLDAIRAASAAAASGVVIGGGLLGLEAAKALKDLGLKTHVVEFAPRLMAVQIDHAGGGVLHERIRELGVEIHTGKHTVEIAAGGERAYRLKFGDGSGLETDLVVFSAGIRPRDELARSAGLCVGGRGGIVIDDTCRTSDPDIFAVGECALWNGRLYGLVAPGYKMAAIAAAELTGKRGERFRGADLSTKLKLMGVDVASIGDAHGATPGAKSWFFLDEHRQIYKKLVLNADATRLLGGILVGSAEEYGTLLQMVQNEMPLPDRPEQLVMQKSDYEGAGASNPLDTLPASAPVCSCNGVSKGAICAAVSGGAATLGAIKMQTKAATSCGGCAALVAQILKSELARRGVATNNHLCEHFGYSRQELFHLVRVAKLRTFDEILSRHGWGLGCDVCKPAVASIVASCWNEFVLARDQAPLQDSNDYFLANIQKNGTYSIVPRIPGGEITPQKLLAIGRVAEKYGLYTKITGGQRIDLFGAQVHELPLIWGELIDAGFESGHAYGKAVRTVKSCVGSAWCRYGVQDSVALAIDIENRYKGLRSPHKIKFAVSGCTRECAEAQSKDVGVIATEKGWNLYVCGNGGMKPRHADLLASDLDRGTLLRYIDRFLMFYIRTADRLQRTSVWLDNLEGGLEYLRQVVCEDRLGIACELESEMQSVVDSYQCEWRKAMNDPQTLRRFRHHINSDLPDANVVFVSERGQRRPARADERKSLEPV